MPRGTGTTRTTRITWRPGAGAWLVSAIMLFIVSGAVADDLARTPPVWQVVAQVLGITGFSVLVLRMLLWGVTATPEGLRVRTGRRVRFLAWDEVTAAAAVNGGNLTIVGTGPSEGVVIEYAGFRAPTRAAAEITALITNPALRPTL